MSDPLHHECGLALVRLKRPLSYYLDKYGTCLWGFQRLYLLMEKQHNRGQDGVGIGCCKLNMDLGKAYLFRERSARRDSLISVMEEQIRKFGKIERAWERKRDEDIRKFEGDHPKLSRDELEKKKAEIVSRYKKGFPGQVKENFRFGGEVLLGHLRYGTSGKFGSQGCHPYVRRTNWPTKTLMVLGNFNMTNAHDLNHHLISRGQHPVFDTDTQTVLEEIGFHLDEAHDAIYRREKRAGRAGRETPEVISRELDICRVLNRCGRIWDGGYAIAGVVGNGDAFVLRDPNGIRPVHYFENDEVIAFASERVPLMTVFGCEAREVRELEPGHVATMKKRERTKPGCDLKIERFKKRGAFTPCSFERIYFSRGNDPDIYRERKSLGEALVPQILDAIDGNLEKTVFSFIPNTAEVAYHGMMDGLRLFRRDEVKQSILAAANSSGGLTEELIDDLILRNWPRGEKVAHKDIKLRTFISQERGRDQMVSHVYDITYGAVEKSDNLVVLDDSIVRGTTLEKSILNILARTNPRKIVIASTAPQIRYPDCYGIDMSKLKGFVAFRAAVSLHRKKDRKLKILDEVYGACRGELKRWDDAKKKDPMAEVLLENPVQHLYEPFTDEQISAEIAELVRPEKLSWKGDIQMIFQTIENLRRAIPIHHGDWYFTGNYPTPGGFRVVNQAFVGFFEGKDERPYDSLLF